MKTALLKTADALRVDDKGDLRVITHPVTFKDFIDRAFGALAQHSAGDMVAALRHVRGLGEVSVQCGEPQRLKLLDAHAQDLAQLVKVRLEGVNQRQVIARIDEIRRALKRAGLQAPAARQRSLAGRHGLTAVAAPAASTFRSSRRPSPPKRDLGLLHWRLSRRGGPWGGSVGGQASARARRGLGALSTSNDSSGHPAAGKATTSIRALSHV